MHQLTYYFVRSLLLLHLLYDGCHGNFYYDLFSTMGLNAYNIKKAGIEAVDGPPQFKGSKGIKFTEKTGNIELGGEPFAFMADAIINSDDLTFAVYFNIQDMKLKRSFSPFLALTDSSESSNYFAIALESQQSYTITEGKKTYIDQWDWSVQVQQWETESKDSKIIRLPLQDKLKFDQWMLLMVRMRNGRVTVSLDCVPIVTQPISSIGEFPSEGTIRFSQLSLSGDTKQFVGSMFKPQLINSKLAYEWYNPCDADTSPSVVLPEPRVTDYNPDKFEKFQKMNSQVWKKAKIYCLDSEGKKHYNNGNPWKKGCTKSQCKNGVIKSWYVCGYCRHGTKQYKANAVWTNKDSPCTQYKCRQYDYRVITSTITCQPLVCPESEQYQPEGACCKKCRGDDCPEGRQYYEGCERLCSLGIDQKCATKKKGCYCPEGYALDENNKCIETAKCKCIITGRKYLPGQSVKQSLCSTCLCSHGTFSCFTTC